MRLTPKFVTTIYFASGCLAMGVAIFCTLFSFAGGLGWLYLLPSLVATILLASGMLVRLANPLLSARLSGSGALLCALPMLAVLAQDIYFTVKQPQFAFFTAIAIALLALLALHSYFLIATYKIFIVR